MKTNSIIGLFLSLICSITFFSCNENAPLPVGGLKVEFDNIVGDKNLILNGVTYTNPHGEEFVVSALSYYVSNFKLYKSDGSTYTIPKDESYFLIKEDTKASQMVNLPSVPQGQYTAIEFVLGIDSLKSTAPLEQRTGVLDPGNGEGMYWSWNAGYIFFKLEGSGMIANESQKFNYHIGLFGGYSQPTINNNRTIKLAFDTPVQITDSSTPEVHIMADIMKVFSGPGGNLKIQETANIMGGQPEKAQKAANNYAQMFTIDHIH